MCYKLKLFKLLYFLDFEHFKQTGESVTGLEYFAWPKGPVPKALENEFSDPQPDILEKVGIEILVENHEVRRVDLTPRVEFDPSFFTERELSIMRDLAVTYDLAYSHEMIEATHVPTQPWHRVYEVEGRRQEKIPYEYALSEEEAELVEYLTSEYEGIPI